MGYSDIITKLNKIDFNNLYFEERGSEPYPVQRIKWLNKLFPLTSVTTTIFQKLKNKVVREDKLIDFETVDSAIRDCLTTEYNITEDELSSNDLKDVNDLIKATVYNVTFSYNWTVYKQVYRFDNDVLNMLCEETDADDIPISVIKDNLPYPAFFVDNKFTCKHNDNDMVYRGCFVTLLQNYLNKPELGLFFIEDNAESNYLYCLVPLYLGDATLISLLKTRNILFNVNTDEEVQSISADLGTQLLKALIYICSANTEIETIKVNISDFKNSNNKKKTKKPKTVNQNYVAYKMGSVIRKTKKLYVYDNNSDSETNNNLSKHSTKSPHMRRAHYHRFWVGKKNEPNERKLITKFIPPLYINYNADTNTKPLPTTIHPVK